MNIAWSANFVRQLRAVAPSDPSWACAQNCADEIERLNAWLDWISVDDADAVAALRGDPSPPR